MKRIILICLICFVIGATGIPASAEPMLNSPPLPPSISGPQNGTVGEVYDFTFAAVDPDGDDVYIYIEFCPGCSGGEWHGPLVSGEELTLATSWESKGDHTIRAQAKDSFNATSDWSEFTITLPYSFIWHHPFFTLIWERLVSLFSVFYHLFS